MPSLVRKPVRRSARVRARAKHASRAALLLLSLAACDGDDAKRDVERASATETERDAAAEPPESESSAQGCGRAALSSLVDSYFSALAAHDAASLPLADDVRFTENAQPLKLGEGLWRTAGATSFRRNLLDTERCGTLTQAVLDNQGAATIVGVRLKLTSGKLSEIESYVVPASGFLVNPAGVANDGDAMWDSILPPDQRSTRAELDAIADGYFNLFGTSPGQVPFAAQCQRFENGSVAPGVMHCSDGIPTGVSVSGRRYPVADLEAGIAAGFVLLFGSLDFHMFKVKNGEVVGIHATLAARASTSGWD